MGLIVGIPIGFIVVLVFIGINIAIFGWYKTLVSLVTGVPAGFVVGWSGTIAILNIFLPDIGSGGIPILFASIIICPIIGFFVAIYLWSRNSHTGDKEKQKAKQKQKPTH